MLHSTTLPKLKILPTKLMVTHEDCDPRRVETLSTRMLEEGLLKNPPIVASVPESECYVVLDGANRATVFAELNIPHVIVQVVDYNDPDVRLDTWFHVVSGIDAALWFGDLMKVDGLRLEACTLERAREALKAEEIVAYIINEEGVFCVQQIDGRPIRDMELLIDIVATYKGKADIYRASNDVWEIQKPFYPDITALIIFPCLLPQDILEAARDGRKIPSGITRHVIPARALNINIPIGILMADWSLERKRKWLNDWWMERMAANAIRFYSESTFSFNE